MLPSENVIKLAERLKNEFGLNVDVNGYMPNRSRNSLEAGGFTWEFWSDNCPIVGGYEPMSKYIVKRNKLEMTKSNIGIEIYAYSPKDIGYDAIK